MGKDAVRAREDRAIYRALKIIEGRFQSRGIRFDNSDAVGDYFRLRIGMLDREVFEVAFLDSKHHLISCERLHLGTIDSCAVEPREVLRSALLANAAAVVLAHNHPSGDPTPSIQDILLTQQLSSMLAGVGIRLIDHVVVGSGGVESVIADMARSAEARAKRMAAAAKGAKTRRARAARATA